MRPPDACPHVLMIVLAVAGLAPSPAPDNGPSHAENDLYHAMLRDGVTLAGKRITFPAPLLNDNDAPDVETAALRKLAGSDNKLKDLLKDSVDAPLIFKLHDVKADDGTTVRVAGAWYVVHAGLDAFDPAQFTAQKMSGKPIEADDMRFVTRLLGDHELKERGISRANLLMEWYTHLTGDIYSRIHIEATDRERGTREARSLVYATRTDPRFDNDPQFPNRWWPYSREGNQIKPGKPERFHGGASVTKISQLVTVPDALLIESHFAYAEPYLWFKGGPKLRVKLGTAAEYQMKKLRRELARRPANP